MAVAMLISWAGAAGFSILLVAIIIKIFKPGNAIPPEDAEAIRKLVWKEDE